MDRGETGAGGQGGLVVSTLRRRWGHGEAELSGFGDNIEGSGVADERHSHVGLTGGYVGSAGKRSGPSEAEGIV